MIFPLSIDEISLWLAVMAIISLVTSELILPYSDRFGGIVIDKIRMRLGALALGASFLFTVFLRIFELS